MALKSGMRRACGHPGAATAAGLVAYKVGPACLGHRRRLRPGTAKQRMPPLTSPAGSPHSSSLFPLDRAARASLFAQQRWSGRGDQTLHDRVSRPWPPAAARQGPASRPPRQPPSPPPTFGKTACCRHASGPRTQTQARSPLPCGTQPRPAPPTTEHKPLCACWQGAPRGRALAAERPGLAGIWKDRQQRLEGAPAWGRAAVPHTQGAAGRGAEGAARLRSRVPVDAHGHGAPADLRVVHSLHGRLGILFRGVAHGPKPPASAACARLDSWQAAVPPVAERAGHAPVQTTSISMMTGQGSTRGQEGLSFAGWACHLM